MSGICGVVASDPLDRIEVAGVTAMLRAMDVTGIGGGQARATGSVAIAALGFPGEPAGVAAAEMGRGTIVLAFHGTVFEGLLVQAPGGTDTARALLDLYLSKGISFMESIAGDIAVAVWDARVGHVWLAVDRFRVKPLFYTVTSGLHFASRMAGILAAPGLPELHFNPECVLDVLTSSRIPTPKTAFREVFKLPPGSILEFGPRGVSVRTYWDLSFRSPRRDSFRELTRETKSRIQHALRTRLGVDGSPEKIGAFLSGGVDSSTVTGELTRLVGSPIKAFSIGFAEQSFNEIEYARLVARAFGALHHEYFVTPADTVRALDILSRNFDEPYANASAVPVFYCAELARQHGVEILYAGDAGDELFAGNPWYATQKLFEYWHRLPGGLRAVLQPSVELGARLLSIAILDKARRYINRASIPLPQRLTSYGFLSEIPASDLFEPEFLQEVGSGYDPNDALYELHRRAPADEELDKWLYIDLQLNICDNDVFKVTRMCSAAGVAVRFPFLDHQLAEFAASVPASVKMRGLKLRSFFKEAYADLLPPEVVAKTKHGFGLPIPVWLRTDPDLNGIMRDLVLGATTRGRGIYRPRTLEILVERHRTDPTSFYGTALWNIMMIELWMRNHRANPNLARH